jgi:hypothetical protein
MADYVLGDYVVPIFDFNRDPHSSRLENLMKKYGQLKLEGDNESDENSYE